MQEAELSNFTVLITNTIQIEQVKKYYLTQNFHIFVAQLFKKLNLLNCKILLLNFTKKSY